MPSTPVDPVVEVVAVPVHVPAPVQAADVQAAARKILMAYQMAGGNRINNKMIEEDEV